MPGFSVPVARFVLPVGRAARRRRLALGLWLGCVAPPVVGQDMASLPTSQLQHLAQQAVERQQYAEAVPALAELERRFREVTQPAVVQAREDVLYLLGVGQLQAGDFGAAATTLGTLLEQYPATRHAAMAQLFRADGFYYQGQFAEARPVYEALATLPERWRRLEGSQRLGLWDRLSDCCLAAQDWKAGAPVFRQLREVAQQLRDEEKTTKATGLLLQAAIGLGELDHALAVLPGLGSSRGTSRFDPALNLALLQGGDAWYERGRYSEALHFYQRVLGPTALLTHARTEQARLEQALAHVAGVRQFARRQVELENELAVARQRRERVEQWLGGDLPDYRHALNFRVARCYLAAERVHEAYWAFERLQREGEETGHLDYWDEAVYGKVRTAAAARQAARVRQAASEYLARGNGGRFVAEVAEAWIRMEQAAGDAAAAGAVVRSLADRLDRQPGLTAAPKLVYLIGTFWVELGETAELRRRFTAWMERPELAGVADGLHYWTGLAEVFAGEFGAALDRFRRIRELHREGPYAEDAAFRIGVCHFGLLEYPEAERVFTRFVEEQAGSRLLSEAHALLGDLAAADGRVDAAVAAYRRADAAGAQLTPPHMGYINHAVFQGGRLLMANQRWAEAAAWYGDYLDRWGARGQLTEALYEQGRALTALGRAAEVMENWIQAIERYGNDPADLGIDQMLSEYPSKYHHVNGEWPVARLRDAYARAQERGEHALRLRLRFALAELGGGEGPPGELEPAEWGHASAAVLVRAARQAEAAAPGGALPLAEEGLGKAGESSYAEEALHLIGRIQARQGKRGAALAAFRAASARFPASAKTARARLWEGDLLREAGDNGAAIAAYRSVLQTRQWRGAPWAEANYKIGLTHYLAGEWKEAFAFCQRVYVLYAAVPEWVAPAYLTSGLALEALGQKTDAAATYREMLARVDLRESPSGLEAARRLAHVP